MTSILPTIRRWLRSFQKRPETGWGEKLSNFSKDKAELRITRKRSQHAHVHNRKTLAAIVDKLKKGDYVFIQLVTTINQRKVIATRRQGLSTKSDPVHQRRAQQARNAVLLTPVMRRRSIKTENFSIPTANIRSSCPWRGAEGDAAGYASPK
jgi:hypothetical protein